MDLIQIAARYTACDKWNHHWYMDKYQHHFAHLQPCPINLLEIGIGGYEYPDRGGDSLKIWEEYFTNGMIYGLDIYDKTGLDTQRIKTIKGSQSDWDFLNSLKSELKFLNIVIDDGSHKSSDVIAAFENLFPWLPDGGIYVVEDTETSYWKDYGGDAKNLNKKTTTMGYFKALCDGINHKSIAGFEHTPMYDLIKSITFYHNMIFITRGVNR